GLGLQTVRKRLPDECKAAVPILTDVSTQLSGAIWDLRHAITDLHHERVPIRSLALAAHDYAGLAARLTDENVTFTAQGFEEPAADAFIPTAFRQEVLALLQEGLSNAARHSAASHVAVMLALQDDTLLLRMEDNGVGFDAGTVAAAADDCSHNGLRNMRRRTDQLGGVCRIESSPGRGTRLLFQIALPSAIAVPQHAREEGAES
ncbi:MAG TPA: ATP-binding protein, partial [Symbiobacteriaceae bacterium]|nr:ATP-binding protein [Symbiobacteriaceae bacterium]